MGLVPTSHSAAGALESCIVFCSGSSWSGVTGSDHHMASELSQFTEVLWVEPPVSVVTPSGPRAPWPRLDRITPRLTRLSTTALPGHSRPGINGTTGPLVRTQIRWALKRLRRTPAAVVACSLDDVLSGWGKDVVKALYGTDDFVAGAGLMRLNQRLVERSERRQLENADIVIAISPTLASRWTALGAKRVCLIPNGVQTAPYRDIDTIAGAADVALPKPVAGVVGHLSSRIDMALLEATADAGCSLLLVGPHDLSWEPERFARLVARDRVRWVGKKPFGELPGYLKHMDVGLTPYCDNEFNRASFPLKTLEYLAAGLPVVSTRLPANSWLSTDLVSEATGASEFSAQVARVASFSDAALRSRRRKFAEQHTWRQRAIDFLDAIASVARRDQSAA